MKELIGSPGTVTGLILRIGQCGFAAASIAVMVSARGFSSYTAFCYLIASMGLQVLWSIGLACLDVYALKRKRDLPNPVLVSLFVVTATLSLAAACFSAGVTVLYAKDVGYCNGPMGDSCRGFVISVGLSFVIWFLIAISSHVMFCVFLPELVSALVMVLFYLAPLKLYVHLTRRILLEMLCFIVLFNLVLLYIIIWGAVWVYSRDEHHLPYPP